MSNTKLVIAGAVYYSDSLDALLIPHFTGEYWMVDCTRYLKKKELKDRCPDYWFKENKENYIEFEGERYYYAEYSPIHTDDLNLLSDLSELKFYEENRVFD